MLAVIGRNRAIANIGNLHFAGFSAWLIWVFVHIHFLIEFDNKFKVMSQWAWNYLTRRQGARLITGEAQPVWMQLPLTAIEHKPSQVAESVGGRLANTEV
jgi:NADH dehydrogenase